MTEEDGKRLKRPWDLSNLPDWPRLMKRETAAAYLDVSTDRLDDLRRSGLISYVGHGIKLFDRKKIDAALDDLSGLRGARNVRLIPEGKLDPGPQLEPRVRKPSGAQPNSGDPPAFLTVDEVAARWEVNHQVVRRLVRSRKLKSFKVGRLDRIPEPALIDYEERHGMPRKPTGRAPTETP